MSEQNPTPEEQAVIDAKEKALADAKSKAKSVNDARTGKGTRVFVGQTRGRSTQVISWEAFDESLPDTLPKTLSELMELTGIDKMDSAVGESTLVSYGIKGYNEVSYTVASDPVAEFVDLTWPEDIQTRFRLVVRNYANGANVSIEDAVTLIKPGIDAAAKATKLAAAVPAAK